MPGTLISIDAWKRSTASRITVRAGRSLNSSTMGANGSVWEPVLRRAPRLSQQFTDDDLTGAVQAATSEFVMSTSRLARVGPVGDLDWIGSTVRIYSGDGPDLSRYKQEIVGRITSGVTDPESGLASLSLEADRGIVDVPLLTLTYTGGGGTDGDVELRGNFKPAAFGAPINVPPVLINAVLQIYQVDAYGNLTSISGVYEDLASFGGSTGDHATYAALAGAVIPEGRWATCIALGLFRLGAPPTGVVTCDPVCGGGLPGSMMLRWLRTHAGVPEARIRAADFDALTAAVQAVVGAPPAVSLYIVEAGNVLDLMQRMCASCNATPLLLLDATITVSRVFGGGSAVTLKRKGGTPLVTAWRSSDPPVPWWQMRMTAARSWYVHGAGEIDYEDDIKDQGNYVATETYRQGMTVLGADGAEYLFINATPAKGIAPPNATYWEIYKNAPDATTIKYQSGFTLDSKEPAEKNATVGSQLGTNAKDSGGVVLADSAVKNSGITISSGGALTGAGGGQVTLGGIGFNGDTDAQRNSRITVSLGQLVGIGTAGRYVDNGSITISGTFLNTGYGNLSVAVANSGITISASGALSGAGGGQVTLPGIGFSGDPAATVGDNLVRNANLIDGLLGWAVTGGNAVLTAGTSADPGNYFHATNGDSQVTPGIMRLPAGAKTLFVTYWKRGQSAGMQVAFDYSWYDSAGVRLAGFNRINRFNGGAGQWFFDQIELAVPDGAAQISVEPVMVIGPGSYMDIGQFRVASTQLHATLGATWGGNLSGRPTNLSGLVGTEGVNNALVTIASNGSLSGGGGGQVTLSGVGFSGDTDAQRNTRITISNGQLEGIGTTGRYIDNGSITISGSFLNTGYGNLTVAIANSGITISSSGALSGGGGGQVTIGGLGYKGDLYATIGSNLIAEARTIGQLRIRTDYGTQNVVAERGIPSAGPNRDSNRIRFDIGSAAVYFDNGTPVEPGELMWLGMEVYRTAAANGTATGYIVWCNGNGTPFASTEPLQFSPSTPGDVWLPYVSPPQVAPPGTAYAVAGFVRYAGNDNGQYYVASPYLGRQAPGADVTIKQPIVSKLDAVTGRATGALILNTNLLLGVKNTLSALAGAADQGNGTGATITIPNHVRTVATFAGQLSISYNGGSITNRAYNTTYLIYADDPNTTGGAVTYVSTTNSNDLVAPGRYHVTTITTPAQEAPPSTGGGGSGGGGTPIYRPPVGDPGTAIP